MWIDWEDDEDIGDEVKHDEQDSPLRLLRHRPPSPLQWVPWICSIQRNDDDCEPGLETPNSLVVGVPLENAAANVRTLSLKVWWPIIKIVINIDWLNDLDKSQSCRPPSDSGLSWREREPTKPGPYRGIFSENILCLLFFLGLIKLACFHPALSTYIKRAVTDIGKVEHRAGIYLECPRRGCHHPPSPAFSWYELLPQCTQDSLVALSYCQELPQAKC